MGSFPQFQFPGSQDSFLSKLVLLNKETDNCIHQLCPVGLPGFMLLNFISLQISKRCQGQRLPLLKGNLRASFLPLPSRWHHTCRLEMFRKRFPLCNQEKHFLSLETAPTFFPSLKRNLMCFPQIIHDWSLALFVLFVDTLQWEDKDGVQ